MEDFGITSNVHDLDDMRVSQDEDMIYGQGQGNSALHRNFASRYQNN